MLALSSSVGGVEGPSVGCPDGFIVGVNDGFIVGANDGLNVPSHCTQNLGKQTSCKIKNIFSKKKKKKIWEKYNFFVHELWNYKIIVCTSVIIEIIITYK